MAWRLTITYPEVYRVCVCTQARCAGHICTMLNLLNCMGKGSITKKNVCELLAQLLGIGYRAEGKLEQHPLVPLPLPYVGGGCPYLTWKAAHPGKCWGHPTPQTAPWWSWKETFQSFHWEHLPTILLLPAQMWTEEQRGGDQVRCSTSQLSLLCVVQAAEPMQKGLKDPKLTH